MYRLAVACLMIGMMTHSTGGQNLLVSPNRGRIGSRIFFTVQDQQAQWKFNDTTRVRFDGGYVIGGSQHQSCDLGWVYPVWIDFPAELVHLNGDWEARIVVGTGTTTMTPLEMFLHAPSCFNGDFQITTTPTCRADLSGNRIVDAADTTIVLTNWGATNHPADLNNSGVVDFGDITYIYLYWGPCPADVVITASHVSFTVTEAGDRWARIADPDGYQGPAPPGFGPVLPRKDLPILWVSVLPEPFDPQAQSLEIAHWAHMALVYVIEENADTAALSPETISVDVVSGIPLLGEADRLRNVILTKLADDGDPASIVYSTPLTKPFIFVDRPLNKANYPQFFLLWVQMAQPVYPVPTGWEPEP